MTNIDALEKHRRKTINQVLVGNSLTQGDLAIAFGRSITTVNSWINGRSTPEMTPQETAEFCDFCGVTVYQLAQMFPGFSKRRAAIKAKAREKRLTPNLETC